jgi:hypothetical protein
MGKTCSKLANIRVYIYIFIYLQIYIHKLLFVVPQGRVLRDIFYDATAPGVSGPPQYQGFMITQRRITFGRTPLNE